MSDGELVRQTLAGQTQAYEELVRRWASRITALCHARVRHGAVAEDLAQETLLRGYRGLATLAEPDKFGSWLCGIAVRICLDWFKSKDRTHIPFSALQPEQSPEAVLCSHAATVEADLERREEVQRLLAEVEALPEEQREVVMRYYYEDVTYRDLAEQLGVSAATVNARLTKARALLRERLSSSRR
jgi:RNA polymerase sigma factor (sigma-70 family)